MPFLLFYYGLTVFENHTKCHILILAFSTNFCPIKTDLSGNTVWPQASDFQKLAKLAIFGILKLSFVHSKCNHSSLRSQCWMRHFLRFSSTVIFSVQKSFPWISVAFYDFLVIKYWNSILVFIGFQKIFTIFPPCISITE